MRVFDIGGHDDRPLEVSNRIWTWANALSFVRLLALPVIYLDLTVWQNWWRAFVLLAVFSATDWFDGYLARRLDQLTRLGKILDPISDRLLFIVVGVAFIVSGLLPLWAVLVLLVRDVLVLGIGLLMLSRGRRPPDVSRLGKTATFGLMASLPVFILARAVGGTDEPTAALLAIGWFGYLVNAVLYWLAAAGYVRVLRHEPPPAEAG